MPCAMQHPQLRLLRLCRACASCRHAPRCTCTLLYTCAICRAARPDPMPSLLCLCMLCMLCLLQRSLREASCWQVWQPKAGRSPALHLSLPDTEADGAAASPTSGCGLAAAPLLGMLKAAASELGPEALLTASAGDAHSALSPAQQHEHAAGSLFSAQLRGGVLLQPRLLPELHGAAGGAAELAGVPCLREVGITGGLGALGLLLARWAAGQGCSMLHLLGRSGRADAAALRRLLTGQVSTRQQGRANALRRAAWCSGSSQAHSPPELRPGSLPRSSMSAADAAHACLAACLPP